VLQNQTVRKTTYASANATAIWNRRRPSDGIDVSKLVGAIEAAILRHDSGADRT